MKRKNSLLAACLLAALLTGCSKKEQPAPPPPKKEAQPAKPPAPRPAPPVQKQLSSAKTGMRLDFSKRTDPFKPFAPVAPPPPVAAPRPSAAATENLLPIQSFEVSKFRVVGIIAGFNHNKALLVDPNGKAYVVEEGMQIGSSNGRITRITPNGVEVVERFREGSGRVRQRRTVLTLAKKR